MKTRPPLWADRFLKWYCQPAILEEIQGDAYELFYREVTINKHKAKLRFIWNVLRFFRWRNIRKTKENHLNSPLSTAMIKSYFIIGFRNITKNFATSFINIFGLGLAIGLAITIFLVIDNYYNLDSMHLQSDRIYLIMNEVKDGDGVQQWTNSPFKLGEVLREEHTAVESIVRINVLNEVNVRSTNEVFKEGVWLVDRDFMNVFSFPISSGNRNSLSDKNSIIITDPMAKKYFGETEPIGQTLSLKFNDTIKLDFVVSAVTTIPDNSSMNFHFLISNEHLKEIQPGYGKDWKSFTNSTFVLLKPARNPKELFPLLTKYRRLQNDENIQWPVKRFELIPLRKVAQRSYQLSNSLSWSNPPTALRGQAVIAILLLILACFNHVNISLASLPTRLKEIGVRKAIGGNRKEIIIQFLMENLVICLAALMLGVFVCYFLILPGLNSLITTINIPFQFSSLQITVTFFILLLVTVALITGFYPALQVASFNVIEILKNKKKFVSKGLLSKMMLTAQFILAFTTITACLVFIRSGDYFAKKDWGYNPHQTIVVPLEGETQFNALANTISQDKNVITYAGSTEHVGKIFAKSLVKVAGQEFNVINYGIGFGYESTMNLRLIAGRFLYESNQSDESESVLVNEAFVKKMNWSNGINHVVELDGRQHYVIGVVEDFQYKDFYKRIEPALLHITNKKYFKYLVAKVDNVKQSSDTIEKEWKQLFPDSPYEGFIQDRVFERFFRSNEIYNKMGVFISIISLVLAGMGLYGLVAFNVTRRTKEFSIRKIHGANLFQIFKLLNKDYLPIVIIAFISGASLGLSLTATLINSIYPEPVPVSAQPFIVAIALMVMIVFTTMISQLRRVRKESPAITLRQE